MSYSYKCNACGELFNDPIWVPDYVDDSNIPAFYRVRCPYCNSGRVVEGWFSNEEEDEEEDDG